MDVLVLRCQGTNESNVVEMMGVQKASLTLQLALPAADATAVDICDGLSCTLAWTGGSCCDCSVLSSRLGIPV